MSLAKRSGSPSGGTGKRFRDGFSEVSTEQMAAQLAAARATADQLLRQARGEAPAPAASAKLSDEALQTIEVSVNRGLVPFLMTPENRQLLSSESGADVEWRSGSSKVRLVGSAKALSTARRHLARVEMHCHWGLGEDKVRRLLRRQQNVESVLCRLSPMTVNKLLPAEKTFSSKDTSMTIGKDSKNDVVIQDTAVSRHHCVITFDPAKGSVYVADLSTNGTYLNGVRLPSKKLGKVLLSHGDELLFRDPTSGDTEFGFICNLTDMSVRPDVELKHSQRLLSADEQSISKLSGSELR